MRSSTKHGGKLSRDALDQAKQKIPENQLVGLAPYRYENITVNERPMMAAATDFEGAAKTSPYWRVDGEWPSKQGEALIDKETAQTLALSTGDTVTLIYDLETKAATVDEAAKKERDQNSRDFTVAVILDTGGNAVPPYLMKVLFLVGFNFFDGVADVL